jgi:hypothetical protein
MATQTKTPRCFRMTRCCSVRMNHSRVHVPLPNIIRIEKRVIFASDIVSPRPLSSASTAESVGPAAAGIDLLVLCVSISLSRSACLKQVYSQMANETEAKYGGSSFDNLMMYLHNTTSFELFSNECSLPVFDVDPTP